jgi:hypothetical protein
LAVTNYLWKEQAMIDNHNEEMRELTLAEFEQISGGLPSLGEAVHWVANHLGLGGVCDDLSSAWDWLTSGWEVRGGRGPERPL